MTSDRMKWLFKPVFHSGGLITFEKWKYVREEDCTTVFVHKDANDMRLFWGEPAWSA